MAQSKIISLFLFDGESNGCVKCTLANWTGVIYRIPRREIEKFQTREDLNFSGVYFLLGDLNSVGAPVVYIGQADVRKNGKGILNRLVEHKRNPKKDYWNEAIVVVTSNNSLGPTEISYLEHQFCVLAKKVNRYEVKNGNEPSIGNLSEEKIAELTQFIANTKLVVGTLGYKLFIPLDVNSISSSMDELILSRNIKNIGIIQARGKQTTEGFVVIKGSHISPLEDDNIPPFVKELRRTAPISSTQELAENKLFSSPSYAAMFVTGKSSNGLTAWKTANGITLKDLENN